ncbi:unnamed protein product [Symbiodinium sp. CCMP2456]|nr:unnamed protein product [Symbiodinium sp. CCMP2456]
MTAAVHGSPHLGVGALQIAPELKTAEAEVSLQRFRKHGDVQTEAAVTALREAAQLAWSTRRLEEGLRAADEARQLLQERRDREGELDFLSWTICALRRRRNEAEAMRFARRRLELYRQMQMLPQVASSLCEIAELSLALDEVIEATEAGQAAELIFKRLKDHRGEARVLLEVVAKVETLKGRTDVAQLAAKNAASLLREKCDSAGEAKALTVLADQLVSASHHEEALEMLGEAAIRFRKAKEHTALAEMLIAGVTVHLDVGSLSKAQQAADTALGVCRQLDKDGASQLASALLAAARANLAAASSSGISAALQQAKEAQELSAGLQDANTEAAARLLLTDAQIASGRLQDALHEASRLATESRESGDVAGEATALFYCFRALRDSGRRDEALATLHQALGLYWDIADSSGAMKCLYALAQVHLAAGDAAASLQALAEVLSMVKRYRRNQRMEASVLQLAAKAMLAMPEKSKALQGFSLDCIQASSQAAEAFREGGDMAGLASALRTLAAAHLQKKSPSQGAMAAKESASLYKDLGDQTGEADSLLQLTVAQLEAERPEDAMPTARAAHDLCKKVSDIRRCALAQELVQLAQTFDKQFKSGLWAPTGKGLTAKIASGMGGEEVRLHRWIPPPNSSEYMAKEEQGQQKAMQDRKFGAKLPFQRKPFPWVTPKEKEKPADPEPEPIAASQTDEAKVAGSGFDWSSTISQPAPVGGLEGYWRCERCGVLFEDPSEGARADADGNFEWFCRSCWRDWVDEHLRRARAAKEAGVSTSQHGGKGGGRALRAKPTEQRQTETKPARPLPSRQELQQLSLIELYKHARSSGADFKLLSIAMDSDNPKTGLLELLAPT